MTKVSFAALSDRGRVRERNEDAWFALPDVGLFGVTDGMGGQAAGELASRIVAETLPKTMGKSLSDVCELSDPRARSAISTAIASLSETVEKESRSHADLRGMGATVVVLVVRNSNAMVAHMGDSRAYLVRQRSIQQLTRDHTLTEVLVNAGELDRESAQEHFGRSQLTRFVGMRSEPLPEVGDCFSVQPGDRLLLCTDGLTGMLTELEVAQVLTGATSPSESCRLLVYAANEAGGVDNITALSVFLD